MKRLSQIFFGQKLTSNSLKSNNHEENVEDQEQTSLMYGVSLAHLVALPVDHDKTINAACDYIKERTKDMKGYRSYARFLKTNPKTKHLMRDQATVFISYAWSGGWGKTMDALKEHFKDKLDETFVWMDFAIVDQHKAATTNIDFNQWAKTFRESLVKIGQACLVLTPGEKPIAISRSWCCFEWTTIAQSSIPFSYCVPAEDEQKLIVRMQTDMGIEEFNTLFAGINVEKAEAFKQSDQKAILEMMREVGVITVNDIVMTSLKKWLLGVAAKAMDSAAENSLEMQKALNARGSLHESLGEYDEAFPFFKQAVVIAKRLPNNEENVAAQLSNLAGVLQSKGNYTDAETLFHKAFTMYTKVFGEDHPTTAKALSNWAGVVLLTGDSDFPEVFFRQVVETYRKHNHPHLPASLNNLAELLRSKGENDAAEPLYREALEIDRKVLGENHPDVGLDLNNLGLLLYQKANYAEAETLFRESLVILKKTLGETHTTFAAALGNLATVLKMEGNLVEAKQLTEQALDIQRKAVGNTHADVAQLLFSLAELEKETGHREKALVLGKQALEILEKALGSDHPDTEAIRSSFDLL